MKEKECNWKYRPVDHKKVYKCKFCLLWFIDFTTHCSERNLLSTLKLNCGILNNWAYIKDLYPANMHKPLYEIYISVEVILCRK